MLNPTHNTPLTPNTGADAELVGIIRGKQVEWEEAASKYEIPPSNESPNTNPSSTRSDVLVGPRYAASETQTNGSLSIEGPMYAALMGQTGARASGPGEGAMFRQTQELAGIPNFDSVHAQEVARSEPGVNAQGNGDHVISRGELEVAGRSTGMAAAAEKHSRAPGAVSEERPQKRGARSVDLDSVDLDGERPASAPSFSEPGGSPSEAAENTAEAVGQKERRKQRLERKRKKESEGDGLPGPLAGFGVQHGEGEQASAGQEAGAEMSHRNGGSMPQSLSGDIDLEPASGQNGEWLEGQEPKTDEAHVTGVAYDAFLEEITAPSRPLSADFPALGAGIRVPAAGGPLKRFTNLRRPESGDDVMGSKSSWAKHISSRAAESEGIAAPSDVRMAQADAVTEEYLRKRAAFEEEDRRKRRKMRTKDDFECFERMKGGKMVSP